MKGSLVALTAVAGLIGGCNETVRVTTQAGKPVLAAAKGMYAERSCEAWEPPEVSLSTPPQHGKVTHILARAPLDLKGNACHGKLIDYRVSIYTPDRGFRGEDKFTIKYDMIVTDGGTRATRSQDVVAEVK